MDESSWPDPLPDDWCWSHGRVEPDDENTYRACMECSHVFQTEADLVRDHNAALANYRRQNPANAPHVMADATSAEEIWTCPHCIHDF
ncbi:hypothetical protein [Streptomyces atriruber]|uniref:hypothetical protein n=1 Tax=Streptomyces atriruber TaxID=545121 RepID=UPI0006E3904C|nr:hypothetical protein [Streptomyces atriruber]